ncbi:MAG: acyl-CoA dehydrogenase family protein, partial [Povalibacter sp.]
ELDDEGRALLRLLTPIAKLFTAKQAVAVVSECIEAFGGAGYVEDTGLPALLRDTQVLPIWEGTTNVLSLDALLRGELAAGLDALESRLARMRSALSNAELSALAQRSADALSSLRQWLSAHSDAADRQAGARRMAFTLARAWQLMLLIEHAQWQLDCEHDHSSLLAARRFAQLPLDVLARIDLNDSRSLLQS